MVDAPPVARVGVAGDTPRDPEIAFDRERFAGHLPGVWIVGLGQPRSHDRVAPARDVVALDVRMPAVDRVVGEQRPDRRGVVAAPRLGVAVEPAGEVGPVVQLAALVVARPRLVVTRQAVVG